ncbi:DUF3892 domain-containing protein [Myxococcus stipitatus]|uniref:DUF3892 domain-containing protein n=1 Tax=Myxococcus stipitatus TaxID=83455 RepID=UPI003145254B
MLRYITAVHLEGGLGLEHIAEYKWDEPKTRRKGNSAPSEMVEWVRSAGNNAYVRAKTGDVRVAVVNADPPYLRTEPNALKQDNLLALPRF